jgi:penicillin-binding protein 1B
VDYQALRQWLGRRRWPIALALGASIFFVDLALAVHYYRKYARVVDHKLTDGRWKGPSRLYAQPVVLRPGLPLQAWQVAHFLDGLKYEPKGPRPWMPGRYVTAKTAVAFYPRPEPGGAGEPLLVSFGPEGIAAITGAVSRRTYPSQALEPQLLTFLLDEDRDRKHLVRYAEMPAQLIQAVLAIEDRRFFRHHGVDPVRIVGAAARNIEAESYAQGGSTITQQLIRNSFLHPEKTLKRKLQEALMALILERRLRKEDILELYLNDVYLGQIESFNIYGVGQAALTYFGKDVSALSVSEAALLAGMIQSPNPYNPYRHPVEARARRDQVIRAMREVGSLDEATASRVVAQPLPVRPPILDAVEAPYFVDLAKDQLEHRYRPKDLARRNLTIQSSLDLVLQAIADDVLQKGLEQLEARIGRHPGSPLQGALIVLEPKSGAVRALVGGRSFKQSSYNRALRARRQPGSAFKPFVYLAAFEATFQDPARPAITPATLLDDVPSTFAFQDEVYAPRNNEGRYLGRVTTRRALASSLNVATVKVAERVGYDAVAELWSKKLGMGGGRIRPYPSVALGSFESTPLELAAAYNVLANGGRKVEPTVALALLDEAGRPAVPPAPAPRQVVHEQAAFLVADMLRSVINEGTGHPVREMGFSIDAAGKTGTTNDSRDAWFAGFTPDLLCVVWVGFDDNTPLWMPASEAALPIWVAFMRAALAGAPAHRFDPPPNGIVVRSIDRYSGYLAKGSCPSRLEVFIAGTEPREYCPMRHDEGAGEVVAMSGP